MFYTLYYTKGAWCMIKIGEFSKLSHLTIKALRFYEKEGILMPASIDEWTGYRFYDTNQLYDAQKIKAYRQIGFSIDEIKSMMSSDITKDLLEKKQRELENQVSNIQTSLLILNFIMEKRQMKYQVVEKIIPEVIVYYSETVLKQYSDIMSWIPSLGEECLKLNPGMKCVEPSYEFCEFLDCEYKNTNIRVRHNEAVTSFGNENDVIKFKTLPSCKVLSIYHKGPYNTITEAYTFIVKYAEENGYKISGVPRERYIDGIWNKESEEDWLTEIELPIE